MSHGEFLNRIQKSLYYGKSKMSIPLSDYVADTFSDTHTGYSLNRLNYSTVGNLRSTPCSLILAMIYLERLKDTDPEYTKMVTPTELFLVSLVIKTVILKQKRIAKISFFIQMIATKFYSGHDDEAPYVNWTECANMTSNDLLEMELNFLTALNWKVYVSNEQFFNKVVSLEIILSQKQGIKRGFYTYMELCNVMEFENIVLIAKQLIKSILVLSLSYTVLASTMVGSVFLASQIPGTYLSTQLTLRNQQSVDKIYVNSTETIQSMDNTTGSNLNNLDRHDEISNPLHVMEQPSLLSSWYSFFNWPVITENFEWNCDNDAQFLCNSTFQLNFQNPSAQPNTKSFKFDLNGLQITLA